MACPLVVFGLTIQAVLSRADFVVEPRDLDVVELWSGEGAVFVLPLQRGSPPLHSTSSGVQASLIAMAQGQDITTRVGFLKFPSGKASTTSGARIP